MNESVKKTIDSLKQNNIKALFFEKEEAAIKYIMNEISPEDKVGIGGSMTISHLGLPDLLKSRGNIVNFHWLEKTPEGMDEARIKASHADVYLTSTNALTEKGQLVNIDGVGNRVAAMIFGPKKVFIVCGINKITGDVDSAIKRIKDNAYKNARRLKLKTPCAATEKCSDCNSPQRMCNVTSIIDKNPNRIDLNVLIIDKELGY